MVEDDSFKSENSLVEADSDGSKRELDLTSIRNDSTIDAKVEVTSK